MARIIEAVDHLMFTGSPATGRIVAEQCGATRLIPFSGELGGKNPMIVLADADLGATVQGAVRASFSNSGSAVQFSIEHLYVEDAVYDEFVPALVEPGWRSMRLGPGLG